RDRQEGGDRGPPDQADPFTAPTPLGFVVPRALPRYLLPPPGGKGNASRGHPAVPGPVRAGHLPAEEPDRRGPPVARGDRRDRAPRHLPAPEEVRADGSRDRAWG